MLNRRRIGDYYENLAYHILLEHGLSHIDNNASCKYGEIDLIMKQNSCIVFVEVRYRNSVNFGQSEATINVSKQQKIKKTALLWMAKFDISSEMTEFRFDVIAFNKENYNWIKNAF